MRRKKAVPQFGVPGALPRKVSAGQRREVIGRRLWGPRESVSTGFLILLMIVCMGILWWMAKAEGSAEGEVRRYLTYLAEGDAEGALSMVDPGVPNEQRPFLTNEVMASASSRLLIESVEPEPTGAKRVDTMSVTATLRLNGDRFTHVFQVDRKDREDSIVDRWVIREGLFVTVPVSGVRVPSFSVGGVSANAGSSDSSPVEYLFFPGVYTFQPEGLGPYVNAQATQVVVENGSHASSYETTSVSFNGQLASSLRGDVLRVAHKNLQDCATLGTNMRPSCPVELRSSAVTGIELLSSPQTLTSASDDGTYELEDAVFRYQDGSVHDLTVRVQATVVMNADGIPEVDIDGKPSITVTMQKR